MQSEQTIQPNLRSISTTLRYTAAALAFTSELIHLWQVPDEFIIWPLRGIFFLLVAIAQGALAVNLIFAPRRLTFQLGIALNIFILAIWTFTRLVGVPTWIVFDRQPVTTAGLAAMTIAMMIIGLLLTLNRQQRSINNPDI